MSTLTRDQINCANARHSTGPVTNEGKARSARNSFKHGLYSKDLIQPGESADDFDVLRADLRAEHLPADTTEDILIDELAQHYWRIRRFRGLEAEYLKPENFDAAHLALVTRSLASAERGFHKSLEALRRLKKNRAREEKLASAGFVPQKSASDAVPAADPGFVPSKPESMPAAQFQEFVTRHYEDRLAGMSYPGDHDFFRSIGQTTLEQFRTLDDRIEASPSADACYRRSIGLGSFL